jgi:ferredoxin
MSVVVNLRPAAKRLLVAPGETVLEAAAGVAYSHGRRSGNCGACTSGLQAGEVERAPFSE